jgi:hypothetical protein
MSATVAARLASLSTAKETPVIVNALIACEIFVVLFIALHDWLPLGKLNNLQGIRAVDSRAKLFLVTLLSTLPFAIGLAGSLYYAPGRFPSWLLWLLWISYGFGLYGMLRTWWLPYFFGGDPERRARYQTRFAGTHAFLPVRHGIRPDTLHVSFHAVVLLLIGLLAVISIRR